jgi:hypothetical protein
VTTAETRLTEALAVLDALKPYQDTGWETEKLGLAWLEARLRVLLAIDAYLAEGTER